MVNQSSNITADPSKWNEMIHWLAFHSWVQSLAIQLPHAAIKEVDLVRTVQAISDEGVMQVHEFTTVIDRRELPETVGFVFEVTGEIGKVSWRLVTWYSRRHWYRPQRQYGPPESFRSTCDDER